MGATTFTIALGPGLTEEEARAIYAQGEETVAFALLAQAKLIAELRAKLGITSHDTPSTPSGMKPVHQKPNVPGRGKKRPGRKPGHPGNRREPPTRIDREEMHRAPVCPSCGGPLRRCHETRVRYIEDIPEDLRPEVTAHTIHRDWCPRCKKKVEPAVSAALPGATLGNRVLVLSAWLHYALGTTLSQLVEVLDFHLTLKLTPGGLTQMWQRLAHVLMAWYDAIREEALASGVLHADETGWRVNGKRHWLWCFATDALSFFLVDRSRASPVLLRFFAGEFDGTLVSDFWGAYNAVVCARRQKCLVHLLRDLEYTEQYLSPGPYWPAFAKTLRRLVMDAIRLRRRQADYTLPVYASRRACLFRRLDRLIAQPWEDRHAKRYVKRLRRHHDELFTFLEHPEVPFENNQAERSIRPAVILRKTSFGNRSALGAEAQAVLMSIFFTLKKRGHNPVQTVRQALTTYLETGQLPPLPAKETPDG